MNTDNQNTHRLFSYLKDAAVFFVTVAACTFLLTVACTFTEHADIIADTAPVLAMPQPPVPLELAAEPESANPVVEVVPVKLAFDVAWTSPEIDAAWALPEFTAVCMSPEVEALPAYVETYAEIPSAPDVAKPNQSIPFHGIIVQVAGRYEVDPHLIRAIILAESGYNPKAKSKKGARGLMQLMPSTAKSLGVSGHLRSRGKY